jgi:CheY-like chemotaxis protein
MTTEETSGKKYKLILVEDDKFLLDMYSTKFNEGNFDIKAFSSAAEALIAIEEGGFQPDIILTDVVMPTMDGFEFLEELKKKNLAPHAVKIVLSNLGQKEDIEKGKALGASGYIIKAISTPSETMKKVLEIAGKK